MSVIESVMARVAPIRSFRTADLISVCTIFLIAVCGTNIGYTQSAYAELNDGLVRVNVAFEIRSAGEVLEFRKRLLDDYNPVFIQNFSTTGIVLDRRDQVMAFLGVGKYFIPDHDTRYEIVTSKGRQYTGKLVGIDGLKPVTSHSSHVTWLARSPSRAFAMPWSYTTRVAAEPL